MQLDLDEYCEATLQQELQRRKSLREKNLCDYCERDINTPVCKFPLRHSNLIVEATPATPFVKIFFDGACTVNPGGVATFGYIIKCGNTGDVICRTSGEVCRGPTASNNIAEWASVTNALRFLKDQQWVGVLEIYGDSQLVINQLTGKFKVKKDTLIPYHKECKTLLQGLEWSAFWIPREENEECDTLSKNKCKLGSIDAK